MNPFATRFVRPDQNTFRFSLDPAVDSLQRDQFLDDLTSTLRRHQMAAIVGPHGTGKTTLLRSIEPALREAFGRVHTTTLSSSHRTSFRALTALLSFDDTDSRTPCCFVVDGYEQLRWWNRVSLIRAVKRRANSCLLVTCHQHPWLIPTCLRTRFDAAISRGLTSEKLNDVAEPLQCLMRARFEDCLAGATQESCNLRELWFRMYDEFETLQSRTSALTKTIP